MLAEHDTTVAGMRVHWLSAGEGDAPPWLLLHGLGSSSAKFVDALPHLAAGGRRAIALDMPGFGASDVPRGSYGPAWMAGGVQAFMDATGLERVVIVGNSYGGLVATHFAAAWPERCEAAVLAAPAFPNDGPRPPTRTSLLYVIGALPGVGPEFQRRYWQRPPEVVVAESLARNCVDPGRVADETVLLLREDAARKARSADLRRANFRAQSQVLWAVTGRRETTWSTASSIRVPLLFLWGEKDRVLPAHIGRTAVERVPGSHLIVLDDCGHNPQMELPREFATAVTSFVRASEARAS